MSNLLRDTWYITRIFLCSLRFYGLFTYIVSIFFPLAMFGFLLFLLRPVDSQQALFLVSGNIVMSIVTICVTTLGQVITNMKNDNAIEFYSTLPIKSISVIFGITFAYMIINTPSFFVILLAGILIFDLEITLHFGFFLFIIGTIWALSGIGAIIGSYSRSIQAGTNTSLVIGFSLYMLAPVFFSSDVYPESIRWITYLVPSTFSAEGIRATLQGQFGLQELGSLSILIVFGVLLNFMVLLKFQFRKRGKRHVALS